MRPLLTPLWFALAAPLAAAGPYSDAVARFQRAQTEGFAWNSSKTFPGRFVSHRGSTDDGAMSLPLLGGIGTGGFARDLQGHFDRWQLQPGFARATFVDAASICLRWEQDGKTGAYRLGEAGWDRPLPAGSRQVAVLWPITAERVAVPGAPVELLMESWSPVVPHDDAAASLPVVFFDLYARNVSAAPAKLDLALFLPNFLGWRKGYGTVAATEAEQTPLEYERGRLGARGWPERSNTGNYAEGADGAGLGTAVMMRRAGYAVPTQDMEGEVLLGVAGGPEVRTQRNVMSYAGNRRAGDKARLSDVFFLPVVEQAFFRTGRLPRQERSWRAETNEINVSAVGGGLTLGPGEEGHFTFVVVMDLPLTEFGSGRTWEKTYTARYGSDGLQARRIAQDALAGRAAWRDQIDRWQTDMLGSGSPVELRRRAACLNDLSYIISGGTAWVAREHPQAGIEPPLLGSGEHFSILEGCDTGYYFCTTFDLWPYAQPAFDATWPHLAEVVLNDYLKIAPMTVADPRVVLFNGSFTDRKVVNKIPHDLGSPSGDPWCQVNEYGSGNDNNVWKDHDPEFILSLYLHRKGLGAPPPTDAEWKVLLGIADFMIAQDKQHDGLPFHDRPGDSTWDALHFTGPSPFSGALTIGAWAAMAEWARQRGDAALAADYRRRSDLGRASFEKYFWNGRYYRSAANGPQAEWILSDSLFGILLAESAGFHGLLPADHVAAHLREVVRRSWHEFGDGSVGPSLLAPPTGPIPHGSQVGEVLVGSARSCVAQMLRFGLPAEGAAMDDAINRTLYEVSGLQFRAPAAWTEEATFRSPANLRPLASWYQMWPDRLSFGN